MSCQLPVDCLNEIFDYLEDDKVTLHSCLLVSRLWCEISVRILWRNVWNFRYTVAKQFQSAVSSQIFISLITCLPNESKDLLYKNEIFFSTSTSKPPLFNYVSFCKVLSIDEIDAMIRLQNIKLVNLNLITQEILKMFMGQISSLKKLEFKMVNNLDVSNIKLTYLPGARKCLTDLTVLNCHSDIYSEFFHQLSQICRNINSLTIKIKLGISKELKDLIASQNCLKHLILIYPYSYDDADWSDIAKHINHSNTLIKFEISGWYGYYGSLLHHVTFPQLQVFKFKFSYGNSKAEILIKFLENNGKNLRELYISQHYNNSLNLAIVKFCPNLKSLFTPIMNYELETLKIIFIRCQKLESIKILCGNNYLNEKGILETLTEYSPKNFCELKLCYVKNSRSDILPKELEGCFINWKNRVPQKSLSFIVFKDIFVGISLEEISENMKIIEKYKRLGIVKFEIAKYH